ncbi:NB-ARC domain-containing protein [Nostoc sp. FACHB-110]|uniref:NB-ARC domain-containing protein n=1 Tax=Nostoc sp. FACHB-110 TaxID=2692834 RepID=UPI0016847B80|nr:NB-ARC domain-containing protein [Nostoc sp. FACHB-110]MBD2441182.1 NACHT domain-containing protein [Nostoc sp. FACHB-110]
MAYSASLQSGSYSAKAPSQTHSESNTSKKITLEEALEFLNELIHKARDKSLSEPEIIVFKGAWYEQSYEEMSKTSTYKKNYLQRRIAIDLFDLLTKIIGNGEQVCKRNLRACIQSFMSQDLIKGSKLPDVSKFYGRTQELLYLKELVATQQFNCISVVGVAGIGKSFLAAKLITDISKDKKFEFDFFIWKSLAHSPRIEDLITELLEIIEPQIISPNYTQEKITLLLKVLKQKRCFIVLDEFEILYQNPKLNLDYLIFIRRLVEENHQSCIIITNRILLDEFVEFINNNRPLQFLRLEGLDTDSAIKLLTNKGITDLQRCHQLIQTYRGNPSELNDVTNRIQNMFGNTEIFFENPTTLVSKKLENILNKIVGNVLEDIHKQIMIYIAEKAVEGLESITITTILNDFKLNQGISISTLDLVKALENLERMSLIESIKNAVTKEICFTLQPVIKKYVLTDTLGIVHSFNYSKFKIAS